MWRDKGIASSIKGETDTSVILTLVAIIGSLLPLAAEQPFDCAGSYKIEGLGIGLFDAIAGDDQTAIVGLPLLRLCRELRALGVAVP